MIRTIIIDDEPSSVNVLSLLLAKRCKNDIEIVASTNSPYLGRQLIEKHNPDLVFLDIEMPGLSGIDLLRGFNDPQFRVVFITAYDGYAIDAFRLSAIDYLLKPIEGDDISRVIDKVRRDISKNENQLYAQFQALEKILSSNRLGSEPKIAVAMADKIVFMNVNEIIYCEAHGAYTSLYLLSGKKVVASKSLGEFEDQLHDHNFFRIHHSYLISLNRVKEFQRLDGGYVMLENDKKLEVSQRKRKDFLQAINNLIV